MSSNNIWVIDDDRSIRWVLEKALTRAKMEVTTFENANGVMNKLAQQRPDAIVADIRMPGMNGLELLESIHSKYPELPVIIMTAHSDLDSAVSAYSGGAFEYLPKPFDIDDAIELVQHAVDQQSAKKSKIKPEPTYPSEIIGEAPAMQEVFRAIGRLSRSNVSVLINGETGTGKELVAAALHRHSPRANSEFIALNMAAIPRDLLESELFGHERGAFTGANTQRKGRFEQANGGTLFLDEIGDMPSELQTRLLRVLADGVFYRVGGHTPVKVDVRIIAATHQNLEDLVNEGRFREDLFHRLNVIRIHIPSLRERREDIPLLLEHFLKSAARELEVDSKVLEKDALELLSRLDWRGNVRQLENTCRWLTVMTPGQSVRVEDLPQELKRETELDAKSADEHDWQQILRRWAELKLSQGNQQILEEAMPEFERIMIEAALQHSGGKKQLASQLLGWGRNTLTRKIKELNLSV
ncbi:nitrogen regulation protein NR(I) [Gammaproteobacteria bacterium AH-315-C21]|nr:nitrogen regulation protein NR(I) [Gammaproteobacteria bacterium AH-315-C21]